jgi:wyosine [tRNA(Phe)-imidazoG37] synthetase (radical SAM superfamily)
MTQKLTLNDHSRTSVGLKYVYPAMSRRSGGLSIGLNFNPNNACNWRCIYCQVPNLIRGSAAEMDFTLLEFELRAFLTDVLHGDFYDRFQIATAQREIKDLAISGNGEPTSLLDFEPAIALIGRVASELGLFPKARFILITNGSLIHQTKVQQGLKRLQAYGGQVWFKLDSATEIGRRQINNTDQSAQKALENLKLCSQLCTTKIQTCAVDYQHRGWVDSERVAYLNFLTQVKQHTTVQDVMLYTIARPSFQPEAKDLAKLDRDQLNQWAQAIQSLGFQVQTSD